MDEDEIQELITKLNAVQRDFFGHAQTLRTAIGTDPPELLLRNFSIGPAQGRAILHLARACVALGQGEKASHFVKLGLNLTGNHASTLRAQLKSVLIR